MVALLVEYQFGTSKGCGSNPWWVCTFLLPGQLYLGGSLQKITHGAGWSRAELEKFTAHICQGSILHEKRRNISVLPSVSLGISYFQTATRLAGGLRVELRGRGGGLHFFVHVVCHQTKTTWNLFSGKSCCNLKKNAVSCVFMHLKYGVATYVNTNFPAWFFWLTIICTEVVSHILWCITRHDIQGQPAVL